MEPLSLNPVKVRDPAARDILRAVLPSFFTVTPDLRYVPSLLADEPTVNVEGGRMEVAFRLRDDAGWSDGRPITVDDVAFTWQVMVDGDLDVADRAGFEHVLGVERDAPKRGRLVFEPPFAGWRDLFSAGRFVLPRQPSTAVVEEWDTGPPVSGGAFVLGPWTRGASVELLANPRFPGPGPRVAGINVEFVPDPTTAIQLLEAGELDVLAPMLGAAWVHRLENVPDAEVTRAYGPDLVHLLFDVRDVRPVERRQRIAQAIRRDRLADIILRGAGRRADGILSPEQPEGVPAWSAFGDAPGKRPSVKGELSLAYPHSELNELTARFVQSDLNAAGVDAELVALDADVFWGEWFPRRRYDLALWESRSGPASWLSRWLAPEPADGIGFVPDETLASVLEQADRGGPEGSGAVVVAQELLAESVPLLPLFQPEVAMAARGVGGVQANPTVDGPLWNAQEWALQEPPL
jgi:ABC-type transport system substrate-binding protein